MLAFYNDLFTVHDISRSVNILYLDFQKAFDKVSPNKFMFKVNQLVITGNVHNWIENWLSNSKQRVVINAFASDWAPVISGVPQGSVLGPEVFTVYINVIDVGLKLYSKIRRLYKNRKVVYLRPRQAKTSRRFAQNLRMV